MLSSLRNSDFSIDKTVIKKRKLEIEYFIIGNAPENTHSQFKLLFLVRNKKWIKSKSYYNENQNAFDSSKTANLILIENQEFDYAFEILYNGYKIVPSYFFSLVVIAVAQ